MKRADRRYMGRRSPPHDVQFVGVRGGYVQGADGRCYVDFIAGWCVGNLGWGAEGKVNVYSTYGWHPLSVEAALANLGYLRAHQAHLLKNAAERSEDFRSRLHQMDFGAPVDIRVTGLAIGLEFEDGAYAGALAGRCRKAGLILGIDDDTLTLFPALTLSRRTVHEGLDILERCL